MDEDDARERLLRVEARERRVAQKVAELARQLDARRAAADDEEREDPAPLVVGEARLRRTLQRVAHRLPEAPRVLQPLEEEAVRRDAGDADVAALRSDRIHEAVVVERVAALLRVLGAEHAGGVAPILRSAVSARDPLRVNVDADALDEPRGRVGRAHQLGDRAVLDGAHRRRRNRRNTK